MITKKSVQKQIDGLVNLCLIRLNASEEPGEAPCDEGEARCFLSLWLKRNAERIVDEAVGVLPEGQQAPLRAGAPTPTQPATTNAG